MVSLKEIDGLLQIVMFTLYGNQYEDREEHLLLSMFEVCMCHGMVCVVLPLAYVCACAGFVYIYICICTLGPSTCGVLMVFSPVYFSFMCLNLRAVSEQFPLILKSVELKSFDVVVDSSQSTPSH